jgi:hypothetical protein
LLLSLVAGDAAERQAAFMRDCYFHRTLSKIAIAYLVVVRGLITTSAQLKYSAGQPLSSTAFPNPHW